MDAIWAEALGNRKGMTFLGASSRRCLGRAGRATAVANTGRRASAQSGCPQNLRTAYSLGRLGRLPVGQRRSLPQRYGICAADMTGLVDYAVGLHKRFRWNLQADRSRRFRL